MKEAGKEAVLAFTGKEEFTLFGNMWASWKKEPRNGCLGFIFIFRGWNPTQLCGEYFINHYRSLLNNQDSMKSHVKPGFFERWLKWARYGWLWNIFQSRRFFQGVALYLLPRKRTWRWKNNHEWRCISCSIAILVLRGGTHPKFNNPKMDWFPKVIFNCHVSLQESTISNSSILLELFF